MSPQVPFPLHQVPQHAPYPPHVLSLFSRQSNLKGEYICFPLKDGGRVVKWEAILSLRNHQPWELVLMYDWGVHTL